jgi:hypothetical protein
MASLTVAFPCPDANASPDKSGEAELFLAGGPERTPLLTHKKSQGPVHTLTYNGDDSLHLCALLQIPGIGKVLSATGNLMVGSRVYPLLLELFRGKLCRLQNQASDWQLVGLELPSDIVNRLSALTKRLGNIVTAPGSSKGCPDASTCFQALAEAHQLGDDLGDVYVQRLFDVRLKRQVGPLATKLSVGLSEDLEPVDFDRLKNVLAPFHQFHLPVSWRALEPNPGRLETSKLDRLIASAKATGRSLTGGPLLDFRAQGLPDWVLNGPSDPHRITSILSKHVRDLLASHGSQFGSWTVLLGANLAEVFDLDEDEWLRLAYHLCDEARKSGHNLNLSLGISQPWAEIMSLEHRSYSPFSFAETVIRTGLPIASVELDMVMGTMPRGGYLRDVIEVSKMIDQFSFLGKPLRILAGFPSSAQPDLLADPTVKLAGGHFGSGHSPEGQAHWARTMLPMMLCKAGVEELRWCHFDDQRAHTYPNCGLIDSEGNANPALNVLVELKRKYLA